MNFFQRYAAGLTGKIEPPAVEPPPSPKEEETRPADTVQPIHIDDEQFLQLTRALRPSDEPGLADPRVDLPAPTAAAGKGGDAQSPPAAPPPASPEPPPGTPIV